MPVEIENQVYYFTSEACRKAGISRSTLIRWINGGLISDVPRRDRHGWRLFTEEEISMIASKTTRIIHDVEGLFMKYEDTS